ncbi:MAG: hypothetical protein ABI602_01545 [Candidatus Saccharibacteria bacterium]
MSLNELSEYYPLRLQLRRRSLLQSWLKSRAQLKKASRRARSKTLAYARNQYYPTSAVADARLAITRNEDVFITTLVLLVVLTFSLTTTALQFILTFLGTATAVADLTGVSGGLLLLVTFAIPALLCTWVAAWLINMFSIAIMDGATRKNNRSLRLTMKRGLQAASRTANAWFLLVIVLAAVPGLILLVSSIIMQTTHLSKAAVLTTAPYVVLACAVWIIYGLAHYSLVPSVALFEPTLPLWKVFGRSRQLVKRRGRFFSLTIYLMMVLAIVLVYTLASLVQSSLHIDKAALVSIGTMTALLSAQSLMVMLYRKRKLARKN